MRRPFKTRGLVWLRRTLQQHALSPSVLKRGWKGRRGCDNLGRPAPRHGGVEIGCLRRDRDLQRLKLACDMALQDVELLAHVGVRNFGSPGSIGRNFGSPGSIDSLS